MDHSAADPAAQDLAALDAILEELGMAAPRGVIPEQPVNAFDAMQAGATDDTAWQTPPTDESVNYSTDAPRGVPSLAEPIPRERAGALVGGNAYTAGLLPYIIAGIKRATGHDGGKDFETIRRDEQRRVEAARGELGDTASMAVELSAPMAGAGMLVRGAKTGLQAAKRGAAAGGAYGLTRGYADPIDPDSLDVGERLAPALAGGGMGAVAGGVLAGGAKKVTDALNKAMTPAPAAPKPKPKAAKAPRPDPNAEALAIERGRAAAAGGRSDGGDDIDWNTPIRNKDDWDRFSGRWMDDIERKQNAKDGPEHADVRDKLSEVAALYQSGHSLNEIAVAMGETGERVAQMIARAPQVFGKGAWSITSKVSLPGEDATGLKKILTAPVRGAAVALDAHRSTRQVPKEQVRAMLDDADSILRDVAAFRRSEALSGAESRKARPARQPDPDDRPPDPEPAALPKAQPEPQKLTRQPEPEGPKELPKPKPAPKAEPKPEPEPEAPAKPRSLRGPKAKPAAKKPAAKPEAKPEPKAKDDAEPKKTAKPTRAAGGRFQARGLSGKSPRSPRDGGTVNQQLAAEAVGKMSEAERRIAMQAWRDHAKANGIKTKRVLSNVEIMRGWTMNRRRSQVRKDDDE